VEGGVFGECVEGGVCGGCGGWRVWRVTSAEGELCGGWSV
jgi:hypothetical protein